MVDLTLWVKMGDALQNTQIVPFDFLNMRWPRDPQNCFLFCRERSWMNSAFLEAEEDGILKFWVQQNL